MDRFNALGRGAQLMLVAGALLIISLFLPWQDFDVGGLADEFGVDATFSGWRGVGVVLGLLAIALVAWLVVRMLDVDLPLPLSAAMISAILGGLVLIFGIIKLLTIIDDEATIWAWIGTILAVLVGIGAWLEVQAAGGVATLRSEMPSSTTRSTTATTDTTTSTSTVTGTQAPEPPPPAPDTMPGEPEAAPPPVEPAPPAERDLTDRDDERRDL